MDNILKMLRISNTPTVSAGEDEVAQEVDEPPDDKIADLNPTFKKEMPATKRPSVLSITRRESLLTRAIQGGQESQPTSPQFRQTSRGMSTTSSHSFASTAELTSDVESPIRSASPSPPPPMNRLQFSSTKPLEMGNILVAGVINDAKPAENVSGEAAIEKSLGRKRCIMFACSDSTPEIPLIAELETKVLPNIEEEVRPEPARKTRISFACPTRPSTDSSEGLTTHESTRRKSSPCPVTRKHSQIENIPRRATEANPVVMPPKPVEVVKPISPSPLSPSQPFHEFASSFEENEAWVDKASDAFRAKLTIDDCYQKEHAIRKIGREAEEEAEAEEREQEEMANEDDEEEEDGVDDFAPSDEDADDGNESDDEEGFAESDSESDAGSDYQFWARSTTTLATSTDNLTHFSSRQSRSRSSSTSSAHSYLARVPQGRRASKVKIPRANRMRPGTPELPDSTDFVCGTFDEDRPLELAYISCREQKRREKQIVIPQDIDPSFPTTDPEDEDDADDDVMDDSVEQPWIKDQFEGFEDGSFRGRRPSAFLVSPLHSPPTAVAPVRSGRPSLLHHTTLRSPPPPQQRLARSPAPRRLFDHSSRRLRSPPPTGKLRSPRGSPTNTKPTPFGITINHLAQRPNAEKTSSLPHTPNPFFRNWQNGSQPVSRITSAAVTPGIEEVHPDLHIRGPVDIVIGLEKKRQKRKEKFWRLHCRKAAKEQAEKKPLRGKGVERMKELGLECAERTKGYNLGQPAHLVLSL